MSVPSSVGRRARARFQTVRDGTVWKEEEEGVLRTNEDVVVNGRRARLRASPRQA
jgi:hypothetical protein